MEHAVVTHMQNSHALWGTALAGDEIDHDLSELDDAAASEVRQWAADHKARPLVFDLGCGAGAHSARLAAAGATVLAFDLANNFFPVSQHATIAGVARHIGFTQLDIRKGLAAILRKPDIIYCHRTLSSLTYYETQSVLKVLIEKNPGPMSFFLNVFDLNGDLGLQYPGKELPVEERYAALDSNAQSKYSVSGAVCLYSLDDMAGLLSEVGLSLDRMVTTSSGEINVFARKEAA